VIAVDASLLTVVTARFNPLDWQAPDRHFRDWAFSVTSTGARLIVAEVQYGRKAFACDLDLAGLTHVGLRAESWPWSKENALNIAVMHAETDYICWEDADVFHRDPNWASRTVTALQHYRVVQTWTKTLDLGPHDEIIQVHRSFADCVMQGQPIVPDHGKFWKHDGGCYDYAHSGFSWACKRELLDRVGGFFELGGMGSGDHHMALAMVGKVDRSWPDGTSATYRDHLTRWERRALDYINGRIGVVHGTIEHRFHGNKQDRGYLSRWNMFVRHQFNPDTDLKRNSWGVLEWAGNKPELEREWDLYLRSRQEDINALR
jgi:hypothetical protein